MTARILVASFILFFVCGAQAQSCYDLFSASPRIQSIEDQTLQLLPSKDISPEEVKLFSHKDSGALPLLLKSSFKSHKDAINVIVLTLVFKFVQKDIYDSPLAHSLATHVDRGLLQKAKTGDWGSKLRIIRVLKSLEVLLKDADIPTGNLLLAETWLKLLGVANEAAFAKELTDLYQAHLKMNHVQVVDQSVVPEMSIKDRVVFYGNMAFKIEKQARKNAGFLKTLRVPVVIKEIPELIKKMHLPKAREQFFLEAFDYAFKINLVSGSSQQNAETSRQMVAIVIFEKAYLEAFPEKQPSSDEVLALGSFVNSAIYHIHNFDRVYQWNELRIEQSLNLATNLNQKLELFYGDVTAALNSTQAIKNPEIKQEIEKLLEEALSLEAKDLSPELVDVYEQRIARINVLHFRLEHLMEQKVVPKQVDDIHSFYDLNYKWARLTPDRPYDIQGKDFDRVVFHKDVIKYFERDLHTGDRFLAALNKGYVGGHNENGIRMIHEIHKDFRYIKVLRTGGKIRILGKLIGRELHLFSIFNRDENFDVHEIHRLIERYEP